MAEVGASIAFFQLALKLLPCFGSPESDLRHRDCSDSATEDSAADFDGGKSFCTAFLADTADIGNNSFHLIRSVRSHRNPQGEISDRECRNNWYSLCILTYYCYTLPPLLLARCKKKDFIIFWDESDKKLDYLCFVL